MLRTLILATNLLVASGSALAWDGYDRSYGHVVSVEPHFVLSFGGGRHHDGFRVLYEVGGSRYWTHSHHHPGHTILVPSYRTHDSYGHGRHHYKHKRHHARHERHGRGHHGRGHYGWNHDGDRHGEGRRGHRGED